jgi:hypothetical protein
VTGAVAFYRQWDHLAFWLFWLPVGVLFFGAFTLLALFVAPFWLPPVIFDRVMKYRRGHR